MKKQLINKPEGSLISYMSNIVKEKGGINLAQGIPGFLPPSELLQVLKNISEKKVHQYAAGNGDALLTDQLEKYYQKLNQEISKDNLLVLNGATEAVSLVYLYLARKFNNKFTAMAFDPTYETYINLPRIYGQELIVSSLFSDDRCDFEQLEKQIREEGVKLLFLNSPGNPYGRILSKEEYGKIAALAVEYDFYIIFDGVYQDLYFKESPYLPLEKIDDRLFYVSSFSKMLSITGWRIGYLICDNNHMKKIRLIHDYTGLCAPSILQKAVAGYLEEFNFGDEYVKSLRNKISWSYNFVKKKLEKIGFKISEAEGGYFVWAKLPAGIKDGFQFAIDLYNSQKVAVVPGIHFSENCQNFVRINIAREREEIEEALARIENFFL